MSEITVNAGRGYPVITKRGAIEQCGDIITGILGRRSVMLVSDTNVRPLYARAVRESLEAAGCDVSETVIGAGEEQKTEETYLWTVANFAKLGVRRDWVVVALGGGVTGDLAGFAAATYMRGVDIVQMPTTLLAAIDSSIGGKTGVNTRYGKNLLGAFHQPRAVIFDSDTLLTLDRTQLSCGMGEGVKYAVLEGDRLYELTKKGVGGEDIDEFVTLCQKSKSDIVSRDERESGLRKLLNLGHTVGHAIEKYSGLSVAHGHAVACGIGIMAEAAYSCGELSREDRDGIAAMLDMYGFDTKTKYRYDDLRAYIEMDKKGGGKDMISVVKIKGIGSCAVEDMSYRQLEEYLKGSGRVL